MFGKIVIILLFSHILLVGTILPLKTIKLQNFNIHKIDYSEMTKVYYDYLLIPDKENNSAV